MTMPSIPWGRGAGARRPNQDGFSILEVLIAAVILIIVMFALAQIYLYGRRQVDFEEDRRKATAVAQARLDETRRWSYDYLTSLEVGNGTSANDTLMVSDNRTYRVSLAVLAENPNPHSTTITATVGWDLNSVPVPGAPPDRSLSSSTIVARAFAVSGGSP